MMTTDSTLYLESPLEYSIHMYTSVEYCFETLFLWSFVCKSFSIPVKLIAKVISHLKYKDKKTPRPAT